MSEGGGGGVRGGWIVLKNTVKEHRANVKRGAKIARRVIGSTATYTSHAIPTNTR